MTIRAYLRASTNKQDANRAEQSLKDFVRQFGQKIDVFYRENEIKNWVLSLNSLDSEWENNNDC